MTKRMDGISIGEHRIERIRIETLRIDKMPRLWALAVDIIIARQPLIALRG